MNSIRFTILVTLSSLLAAGGNSLFGQSTVVTYQGRVDDGGSAANGNYDLRFTLFGANSGGVAVGVPITNSAVHISNGLFTVTLDFGASVFTGVDRWLEVGVRTNGGGPFAILVPRQQISSTPYAVQSRNATLAAGVTGNVSATQLTGTISPANIASGTITAAMLSSNAVSRLSAPDGSPTNAVQVHTNGLVGIGTTTPQAGLDIVSGSTMIAPQVLFQQQDESGGYTNLAATISVASFGNLLAIAGRADSGITLLDVSNPRFPSVRSQFRDGDGVFTNLNGAVSVAMKTNLLIVAAEQDDAVTLISVANPANPVKLAELRHGVGGWNELNGVLSVAIAGNLLAIAGYGAIGDGAVTLADISNPAAPIKRVEIREGAFGFTNLYGAGSVALSGNLLAIGAFGDNAVTLVDVTDPANPLKRAELRDGVGGFDNLQEVWGVALSGSLLAIAARFDSAVTLVNVASPSNPAKLAEWKYGESGVDSLLGARAVAFSGNWLAVSASENSSVTLFDISNPSNSRLAAVIRNGVAGFNFLENAWGLTFVGTNLAVAGHNEFYGGLTLAALPTATVSLISQSRVGIGTASPTAPLHVMGNVVVQDADLFDINTRRVELGFLTTASGFDSTAMGSRSTASGSESTAMGYSTTASGETSTAMGRGSIASGDTSTAMGFGTIASEFGSTAMGSGSIASGPISTAMGERTTASGYASTAMGYETTANGDYTTAMGARAQASGDYSFAAGRRAKATNDGSFIWADSQNADFASTGNNQFLIRAAGGMGVNVAQPRGKLHVGTSSNVPPISLASHTIIIDNAAENGRAAFLALAGPGGSTDTNRVELQLEASENQRVGIIGTTSNHEVQFRQNNATRMRFSTNGNIGINETAPQARLHVSSSGSSAPHLHLEQTANNDFARLRFSSTTKPAWDLAVGGVNNAMNFFSLGNGNVMVLTTNGTLNTAGPVNPPSDRHVKSGFEFVDTRRVLEKVASLPLMKWAYTNSPSIRHIGPVAQDFHAAFGVGTDDKHIATVDADGVALAAIQGLNQKVEQELRAKDMEIGELKRTVSELKEILHSLTVRQQERQSGRR